ncbi:MFS transporter, DHA1 family, arabinose polymer transporter [Klenkia soli]|uniref:MFS transporter, DHA1 family, arabinose polymer transporter n=1 Tax=Klenkia soli TaxID=1052260 RepID=A0A1H0EER4_9ACTN|nr:MFS transporter [Klenkia soli]SDN80987.1 MFS transporter, DHA1 family, arabinose polymer transporter [Klenkia soli]
MTVTAPPVVVPDTRRAVLAIVALGLGAFGIGVSEFVTMGLLPEIARGVGVSIPSAGHLVSAYALGVVVGAPVIAATAARLPRKGLLLGLLGAFLAGTVLTVAAPGQGTLLLARFVAGLPHGAYFGVASLVAASLVRTELKGRAVSSVMLGLAAANLVGVPAATWLGQHLGWRSAFVSVVVVALLTAVAVLVLVPRTPGNPTATISSELGALRRPQVWLTLGVAVVGFGGVFALYAYIAPITTEVTGMPAGFVPVVLLAFGIGGVVGTVLGGKLADVALFRSLVGAMVGTGVLLGSVLVAARHPVSLLVVAFLVSVVTSVLVVTLQLRLMEVAGDAELLGAAANHSALNAANGLGAYLGGVVIAAGWGYPATSVVGVGLAVLGLVVLACSAVLRRRELRTA